MFAVLHSDINSLKSSLLYLTGGLIAKRIDQQNYTEYRYAECHYAECSGAFEGYS